VQIPQVLRIPSTAVSQGGIQRNVVHRDVVMVYPLFKNAVFPLFIFHMKCLHKQKRSTWKTNPEDGGGKCSNLSYLRGYLRIRCRIYVAETEMNEERGVCIP